MHRGTQARRGGLSLPVFVVGFAAACMLGVLVLLLRPNADPGIRVWLLNHQPDQALIVNPISGRVEKKFLVADGLKELAFSRDGQRAYVANVVDVSNRLTVLDTRTYLTQDEIEVDGVPQGIGVFPDDNKLAVILGSKTDFMAGGFDVLDLAQRSPSDPHKRVKLYRERELALTHKIAVSEDGDRIYCIDAKKPLINIYSFSQKKAIGEVDLRGSPEELLYPQVGKYYYASVLQHYCIYQIDKKTDQITGVFVYTLHDPDITWEPGKLRFMATDRTGDFLFASCMEAKGVAMWQVGNPEHLVDWNKEDPAKFTRLDSFRNTIQPGSVPPTPVSHYRPALRFKLKGGYKSGINYVPGPQQVALDTNDLYVFVVDEDGALYIYNRRDVMRAKWDAVVEPRSIVSDIEGEMRDLKVTRPLVLGGKH